MAELEIEGSSTKIRAGGRVRQARYTTNHREGLFFFFFRNRNMCSACLCPRRSNKKFKFQIFTNFREECDQTVEK